MYLASWGTYKHRFSTGTSSKVSVRKRRWGTAVTVSIFRTTIVCAANHSIVPAEGVVEVEVVVVQRYLAMALRLHSYNAFVLV